MYNKPADSHQASLFGDLESMLNRKHSLYILANLIDWDVFESGFKRLYCSDNGRPSKPVRLMTGLLMLKHVRNISEEGQRQEGQGAGQQGQKAGRRTITNKVNFD